MHFEIESGEGLPIRGEMEVPHGARALVVITHGFKGFKDWGFFPWLADDLWNHGFAVCRFNMSRSGIGEDPESFDRLDLFEDDTYSAQIADLVAVVEHAQAECPKLPTFLLGHSRGGGVVLLASREVKRLHGVITWSSISHVDRWDDETKRMWRSTGFVEVVNQRTHQTMRMSTRMLDDVEANRRRLDIRAAARRLKVPLLVIHGGRDESVAVDEARQIATESRDSSLLIVGSATHTFNAIHPLVHIPPQLDFAAEVSARFVSAYAGRKR